MGDSTLNSFSGIKDHGYGTCCPLWTHPIIPQTFQRPRYVPGFA